MASAPTTIATRTMNPRRRGEAYFDHKRKHPRVKGGVQVAAHHDAVPHVVHRRARRHADIVEAHVVLDKLLSGRVP